MFVFDSLVESRLRKAHENSEFLLLKNGKVEVRIFIANINESEGGLDFIGKDEQGNPIEGYYSAEHQGGYASVIEMS